jgi:hypothetical protein
VLAAEIWMAAASVMRLGPGSFTADVDGGVDPGHLRMEGEVAHG